MEIEFGDTIMKHNKLCKEIIFVIICFILVSCTSCIFDGEKKKSSEEPVYEPDVVWKLETNAYDTYQPTQNGQFLYLIECNYTSVNEGLEQEYKFSMTKVDLLDGHIVWTSPEIFHVNKSPVVVINDRLYVQTSGGYLYVIGDDDGKIDAVVSFTRIYMDRGPTMISCGGNLFWSNINGEGVINEGLLKFDVSKIDFTLGPEQVQHIEPRLVWTDDVADVGILMRPVAKDGIVYFQTYDFWQEKHGSIIKTVAIDADSEVVKWQTPTTTMNGDGHMQIFDDRLYFFENVISCYDLETGKCLKEKCRDTEKLDTEVYIGADSPAYYSDGKFYYTNNTSWATSSIAGIPQNMVKNIICIDAKTFAYVWGDLPKGCGSLNSKPVVANGKTFVATWGRGLRVYNSETGELIGAAENINTHPFADPPQYNGCIYYFDADHKNLKKTLMAIKP